MKVMLQLVFEYSMWLFFCLFLSLFIRLSVDGTTMRATVSSCLGVLTSYVQSLLFSSLYESVGTLLLPHHIQYLFIYLK